MERLEREIKEAEEFRDKYYLTHPESASLVERNKAVRERILPLLQDIPLETQGTSSTAQYNLICGRILNISREYDPKCEKHLTYAIKMDPSLGEAWYELGECLWKKREYETAVDCFRASLERQRTAKCLCALSMALRHKAQQMKLTNKDMRQARQDLFTEAFKFCEEAVALDKDDGHAWHSLGNAMLLRFFMSYQRNFQLMERAKEAYERALSIGDEYLNPDLHTNYATALKFTQDYSACIDHLKTACLYDPSSSAANEELQYLTLFLLQINESVRRKGKLKPKRLLLYQNAITKKDLGIYGLDQEERRDSRKMALKEVCFADLQKGSNPNTVICGKVIGVIPNSETVPYTFVGCDRTGNCITFFIYNCSSEFGFIIGDSFAVPEPYVVDVKAENLEKENTHMNPTEISFRAVRVTESWVMAKNGKLIARDLVAHCEMQCTYVS